MTHQHPKATPANAMDAIATLGSFVNRARNDATTATAHVAFDGPRGMTTGRTHMIPHSDAAVANDISIIIKRLFIISLGKEACHFLTCLIP
jgi:hypothetical protein